MSKDRYTDDEYDDTYKDVHGDEGAREQYTDDGTDDTFFPSGTGGRFTPTGWGFWPSTSAADAEYDERQAGEYDADEYSAREAGRTDESDESWWDEGLIGLLLVAGVVLFIFPEPATTAIGIGLIAVGVVAWIVDWLA